MFTDISVKLNYIKILKLNKMSFVSTAANQTKTRSKSIIKITGINKLKKNIIILAKCCHLECLNVSSLHRIAYKHKLGLHGFQISTKI